MVCHTHSPHDNDIIASSEPHLELDDEVWEKPVKVEKKSSMIVVYEIFKQCEH